MVSGSEPDAAMPFDIDFYLNPQRGGTKRWPNRFAVMAWSGWLDFDAIAIAPQLTAPYCSYTARTPPIPDGARRFHDNLAGPKTFLWTEGVQFDFYDQPPQVGLAADAAAEHFARTL
ncbi:hypothetical protein [Streptomyces sp. NBC_01431]|uniref:hypothetical protein n=1 Tax=Streptomyces sp. NBC_01431 TaxID=2903863 RepID=UPI002E35133C|nr:hypothetical protein [Streptomyces sp. NBC_01431]